MRTACLLLFGIVLATDTGIADAQQSVEQAVDVESQSIEASASVQQRIDRLDDATRQMLEEYRQATAQISDLNAYNEQLERLVATQRVELADYERQFNDIEVTKRRILPLIVRQIEVLDEFVGLDIPFLERERRMRIAELRKLMERPEVPTSEKYRRVSEAYQIELEYGHTIEAYEGELEDQGQSRTVNFLRFGRLGLFYLTLDGLGAGFYNNQTDQWEQLGSEYLQPLDRAIRIARKQLPPDLVRLPVPAPEDRT
ncbi:MAG: DUF3450 domain-containing protein [Woeseiaceae bacterium]|jgi:hypothetical protein|nr:DUF3450 domain-containing protein [Woeseiaceae bacterium]